MVEILVCFAKFSPAYLCSFPPCGLITSEKSRAESSKTKVNDSNRIRFLSRRTAIKLSHFLLKYGTSCTAGKYMATSRIFEMISIAIYRDDPDLTRTAYGSVGESQFIEAMKEVSRQ